LTRTGVQTLLLQGAAYGAPSSDLRVRLDAGVGDLPPRVDDPDIAERVVTWLRWKPTERLENFRITWLGVNCADVEQGETIRGVDVAQGTGAAGQVVQLPGQSVDPTSLDVQIEASDEGFARWMRVPELAGLGRDDRGYVLDAEAGTLSFGDNVRGRAPEVGARIRVIQMRAGGGLQGNLPPGTLQRVQGEDLQNAPVTAPITVYQPLATRGGRNAETLAEAEARIPAILRHRNRAVTEQDFRTLAATTPGLSVGRVEVMPRFKPQQREQDVPGVVSVMVLPSRGGLTPPAPRADRFFLDSVHAWLDDRRPVATELYVITPAYVPLGASVGVRIREGFDRQTTLTQVRTALRAYMWPLPPGGPTSAGWGLGVSVLASEVSVAVARVPGVAAVLGVRL
ncbi:MAG: putative baseplate assembly protein, partial [Myxococcota bacterium]